MPETTIFLSTKNLSRYEKVIIEYTEISILSSLFHFSREQVPP